MLKKINVINLDIMYIYLQSSMWEFSKYCLYLFPRILNFIILKEYHYELHTNIYNIKILLNFLKLSSVLNFKFFIDLIAVDYPSYKKRFKLIYSVLNLKNYCRCFIIIFVKELIKVCSITSIFSSSNWSER